MSGNRVQEEALAQSDCCINFCSAATVAGHIYLHIYIHIYLHGPALVLVGVIRIGVCGGQIDEVAQQ